MIIYKVEFSIFEGANHDGYEHKSEEIFTEGWRAQAFLRETNENQKAVLIEYRATPTGLTWTKKDFQNEK